MLTRRQIMPKSQAKPSVAWNKLGKYHGQSMKVTNARLATTNATQRKESVRVERIVLIITII
jgi:hypothetical protein|tara:strand:+ start:275 stop:460 length:186 start_codon:yes stop_codon:yes gene_type:complete